MHIRMVGIDHRTDIAIREAFSFTQQQAKAFMTCCLNAPEVEEAVLLTTCGRTELWTVGKASPRELLQLNKGRPLPETAVSREDGVAALHLHRLACGLCSQVCGDEQIITQVREAADAAGAACGPVLSQLFRSAVTAGKQARTEVGVLRLPRSVASQAVERAAELLGGLEGKRALVVGSGAMGKLTACLLMERGVSVTMTRRQYHKSKPSGLPPGVDCIDYDDRYAVIGQCDLAVGATSSPHHVLRAESLGPALSQPLLLMDIALPRDVEPASANLPGVTLVDLDHLCSAALDADALDTMERIAAEYAQGFGEWLELRAVLPSIEAVRGYARLRMAELKGLTGEQRHDVEARTMDILDTLLFTVKKREGLAVFKTVSHALGRAAEREGNKT